MIIGIGTDIIEIDRIKNALERTPSFLEKTFTEAEIKMFQMKSMKTETIAGNFAAKEAISKAVGTGMRGFSFKDIEIIRDELGKPIVNITKNVEEKIYVDKYKFNVSISHNKESAIAFVVLEEI